MRRTLLAVLLGIVLAPMAWGQDCKWCDMSMEPAERVMWGKHAFCSKDCRQEWYLDRFRCKICNDKVEPKSNRSTHTDGVYVYTTVSSKPWDGYCDHCRDGVKIGQIDPVKDRYVAPKTTISLDHPNDPDADKVKVKISNSDEAEKKTGSYFTWALGLGVGAIFLIAKMLR